MRRRQFLVGAALCATMPCAAQAQTAEDQVVSQLKRQGYRRIEVYRTLLGRTRILAIGPRGRREVILHPSTGAILRDYEDRSYRDDTDDDREDSSGRDRDSDDDEEDDGDNSGKGNADDRDDNDDDGDDGDDDDD